MSEELLENQEAVSENPATENKVVAEELPEVEVKPRKKTVIENEYASVDNFDWEGLDKKGHKYNAQEQANLEEQYTKSFKSIDEGGVIMGTVVSINSREIVVNIGFKSDGVIAASEMRYNPNLKIGDEIEGVVIAKKEGTYGKFFLVIEEDEGDRWITTQCGSLHRQILKGRVEEGDYVKVVYNGRKNDENNSHDYQKPFATSETSHSFWMWLFYVIFLLRSQHLSKQPFLERLFPRIINIKYLIDDIIYICV